MMMRVALLLLALAPTCDAILPELVDSGVGHILEDQTGLRRVFVEVEQLQEDPQPEPEDPQPERNTSTGASLHPNETAPDRGTEQETNNITAMSAQDSELANSVYHGCVTDEDCGKGTYCLRDAHKPKCLACKATDVPCSKDEECCDRQLCVWGQCSHNATAGEPGTTCQQQSDCSPDLCCAFHQVLLFPICLAKPVERERCFGASNHLMQMLSWNLQGKGPRKHCPCAGNLHCQHLGRGSMCLKGKDSSEEELTDSLYSEIDYII